MLRRQVNYTEIISAQRALCLALLELPDGNEHYGLPYKQVSVDTSYAEELNIGYLSYFLNANYV